MASLLETHKPDILILTGHDGVLNSEDDGCYENLVSYRNSRYYIDAVKAARKYCGDIDELIIFAGACQSMYMEIIKSGANFASSPYRVLIHAFDPVRVAIKIAQTSVDSVIDPKDIVQNTITGMKGIGGLQTRGKMRSGYPQEPHL